MSLRTVAPQQKYGLVVKKKGTGSAAQVARQPLQVSRGFSHSDDELDDSANAGGISRVNRSIVQRSSNAEREAAKIYSEALSEDSSVFDYDGAYDSFKTAAAASHPLSRPTLSEAPVSSTIKMTFAIY